MINFQQYISFLFLFLFCFGSTISSAQKAPQGIVIKFTPVFNNNKAEFNTQISNLQNELNYKGAKLSPMFANKTFGKEAIPYQYDLSYHYILKLDNYQNMDKALFQLNNLSYIKYAEALYYPELLDTINDPLAQYQYHLPLVQYQEAFDLSHGDSNIVIGIVDTGIDLNHEDLYENIKRNYNDPINGIDDDGDGYIDNYHGWDIADNDLNPQCTDSTAHGVLVAGSAAATTNNSIGIGAIAYHCKYLPIKAANNYNVLTAAYQGVVYAADHGCQIINCSWGDTTKNLFAEDIMRYAIEYRGCVVVAAAGNARNNTPYYPASCKNVISVGAIDKNDIKWSGSTYGIELDMVAPGVEVYTTSYGNGYTNGTYGTSFAAPIVSGTAALLMAHRPELSNLQIAEQIRVNCDVVDTIYENQYYAKQLGYGRVNAFKALSESNKPGLRITNHNIASNNPPLYSAGDTLLSYITITNFLAETNGTSILLKDNSNYTDIIKDITSLGGINTMDSLKNNNTPFKIVLSDDTPLNHELILEYNMAGEGYDDYQQFKLLCNQSFIDLSPNKLKTSFTSNGNLGHSNRDKKHGVGFVYNNLKLLYKGGLILANSTNEMVSAFDYNNGFIVNEIIDTIQNKDFISGQSSFKVDTDKWNAAIDVIQKYKAYTNNEHNSTIFTSYTFVNNDFNDFNDFRVSLHTDWDIHNYGLNKAVYDEALGLLYTYSFSNTVAYAGICILNETNTLPYCFDLVEGGNGGIDITSNFSDEKKWLAMNNIRENGGSDDGYSDVASMFTCGPFQFKSGDTIKLDFAIIAAANYNELRDKSIQAKFEYINKVENKHALTENLLYPNPTNDIVYLPQSADDKCFKIYSSLGKLVMQINNQEKVNISHLNEGIYYVYYSYKNQKRVQKLIISQ